jgi:HSP20 family protein
MAEKESKERGVARWEPFRELEEWERSFFPGRLGRFFEEFERGWPSLRSGWGRPAMDVSEDENRYTITFELPGVKKEDVTVEMTEGRLSIHGEKKSEREEKKERVRYCERSFGTFTRSFYLPADAEGERIVARFQDGVLTLEIPKKPEAKPKTIAVK